MSSEAKYCCFLCVTPFHVLTAITLNIQLGYKSDIFIMDMIPDSEGYVERIKKENIFNDVILLSRREMWDNSNSRKTMYIEALKGYFKIKKMIRTHMPKIDEYTDVFIPCMDIPGRYIYCYKKKYKDSIKIHIFDEGIGSYIDYAYSMTKVDYLARRFILGRKTVSEDFDIFLYSPEYYATITKEKKYSINRINILNKAYSNIIKRVFRYDKKYDVKNKYIIFDTVRVEEGFKDGGLNINNLFSSIVDKKKDVIVKPHPRDAFHYIDCGYYSEIGIPFEVICYLNDFSDKCLITLHSSACYYPKLLFDQEPQIVFLYNITRPYIGNYFEDELLYMNSLKDIYENPDKVFIPKTIQEFNNGLERI